jgi:hypothetical protein
VGTSRSHLEGLTSSARDGKKEAFHIFLRLSQPPRSEDCPPHHILRAGKTYAFPFVFIVPDRLLIHVCQHQVDSDAVREAHLRLPPSFGDHEATRQLGLPDDLSSDNASVRYGVYARLVKHETSAVDTKVSVLAAKAIRMRVVPAFAVQASRINSTQEYKLRNEVRIPSSILGGKRSGLVIETTQPPAFCLSPPRAHQKANTMTMARVALRFDPADERCCPPSLRMLTTILKATTYLASSVREQIPTKESLDEDASQAAHSSRRILSRLSVSGVEWKKYYNHFQPEASETLTTEHIALPKPSQEYNGGIHYYAAILVPLSLPQDVTFVPTFHSCLLSIVYSLQIRLAIHGCGIMSRSTALIVPIQIVSEGRNGMHTIRQNIGRGSVSIPIAEDGGLIEAGFTHGYFGDAPPPYA